MSQPTDEEQRISTYPVSFSVAYPELPLNRVTTAVRAVTAVPIMFLLVSLRAGPLPSTWSGLATSAGLALSGIGVLAIPVALMLIVRQKYPRWWYDWNLELLRFANRVMVYLALMTDRYPSTDEQQSVELNFPYPAPRTLSRGLPAIKWLLATPHYFALAVLFIFVPFFLLAAWVSILITGRYPRPIFAYIEGVLRWGVRVTGYAYALVTDEYPPFSLGP